jgi:hypothetical protein
MTQHAYPTSAMLGDYIRAAAGFVPTAALLATIPLGTAAIVVLGGFAALFAVFGVRTALRHGTHVELTETALLASGPLPATISWSELDRVKLAYYSTRRDRRTGWMQLELHSGWSRLRLDSRIEGFAALVEASARAAEMRGLAFDSATSVNLQALGIKLNTTEPGLREATGGAA